MICNDGRTAFVKQSTCAGVELCDEEHGQCDVCVPGTYSCMVGSLLQCDSAGQATPVVQECGNADRCHANGTVGLCYLCDVGEYRCSAGVLQQCNAATRLSFDNVQDCGDMTLCMADGTSGMCLPDGTAGAPG
jgi:hypothetical protein